VPLGVLEEVEVEVPVFDAYQYENNANYAFRVNGSGYKVVTIRNVRNIANGEYYIGDYENNEQTGWDRGYKDFLCTTLAANSTPQAPRCQAPVAEPPGTLCFGYSTYNNCITYNAGTSTWSLGGTSLSQGITWFEGNINVGNGVYYNTFIATGNITTSGGLINYAPNYAGYSGAVDGVTYAPRGVCSNGMSVYVPAQLCNEDSTYNPEGSGGMGNYAFMAGGIVAGNYSGGNITLGSSNQSYGNILAGNDFASGGSTVINGFITALAGGVGTLNVMGGSTTINLDVLPPSYTPTTPGTGGEDEEATISVQLLWTRYL
jgi:hypothetical protein